jgi:hypothetical protein
LNAEPSTICGIRGALAMSRIRFNAPCTKLSPAVSTAALDRGRVEQRDVARRQCGEEVLGEEPHPLVVPPAQAGVGDQLLGRCGQVAR